MTVDKSYWQYRGRIPATPVEEKGELEYEREMFDDTCRHFSIFDSLSSFQKNLLVESLALHARVLIEFFYESNKRKDDITAQDFMPTGVDWKKIRPPITQTLYDAREKAHKLLAHLSRWRLKLRRDGKKDWNNHTDILKDLDNVIERFNQTVKKDFKVR